MQESGHTRLGDECQNIVNEELPKRWTDRVRDVKNCSQKRRRTQLPKLQDGCEELPLRSCQKADTLAQTLKQNIRVAVATKVAS